MKRSLLCFVIFALMLFSAPILAGGGGGGAKSTFDWKDSSMKEVATQFVLQVAAEEYGKAYGDAGAVLRENRAIEDFTEDMKEARFNEVESVTWNNGIPALPVDGGFKLTGEVKLKGGDKVIPVYLHVEGDAHIDPEKRNRAWSTTTQWTVMDYRSAESMKTRLTEGTATSLDWILTFFSITLFVGFLGLIFYYVRGLAGCPMELYLLFFTKVTEYSAYGAASAIMVRFLQNDVFLNGAPLGDSNGYLYYTVWSLSVTVITIMVGAVCDTIGVKKCLMVGAVMLLVSRFCTPLTQNVFIVTILGFIPLAIGFAVTGPVLKVGIKKFTTMKQATLGFGLFYTLMNVGFAIGAEIADYFRAAYGDAGVVPVLGLELTTYQAIIAIGFLINIPDFIAILMMRDGAEMTENGFVLGEKKEEDKGLVQRLIDSRSTRRVTMQKELMNTLIASAVVGVMAYGLYSSNAHELKVNVIPVGKYMWAMVATMALFAIGGVLYAVLSIAGTANTAFDRVMKAVRDATEGTIVQLKENFQERPFWIYMGMLGILVFVRLTFYIFHLMFPTYAIRVFGADFPVASIFGTLNPVMIIFLVPLISALTINVRSFKMLMIGTSLSAISVFLCFIPEPIALALSDSWFGVWVFDYWLEAPVGNRDPFMMSLVVFIMVFTVGEAIWSPRLMQFSAEIAPRGKEGAYIALAMLPYFLGKAGAGVLSEQMTTRYFNATQVVFPDHEIAWLWIGGMALISPIGLIFFRKTFTDREEEAAAEALRAAEEDRLKQEEEENIQETEA